MRFLTIYLICLFALSASAQLEVEVETNDSLLINKLIGKGVTISNIIRDCPDSAAGYFNATNTELGLDSGVLLTSGNIVTAIGPNNSDAAGGNAFGPCSDSSDADLDSLLIAYGGSSGLIQSHEHCSFEFDIVANSAFLQFEYIFASEEYPEFVCSEYNDIFAFFISGPGIIGKKNIALIPGTQTPVLINTLNGEDSLGFSGGWGYDSLRICDFTNGQYYVSNDSGPDTLNIQYDGYTTVLPSSVAVIPCITYRFKLAIADAGDCAYDSGIFLKAGSICSPDVVTHIPDSLAIEGCDSAALLFTRSCTGLDTAKTVHFIISGSATNGVDYDSIPDSVTFAPFEDSIYVYINPKVDSDVEGVDTIKFTLINECTNTPYDQVIIIHDNIPASVSPADTSICFEDSILFEIDIDEIYGWNTNYQLPNPDNLSNYIQPDSTITIFIETNYNSCLDTLTSNIEVLPTLKFEVIDSLAVEGCDTASILITRRNKNIDTAQTIYFNLAGSAQNGIDFENIPDSITFPPNEDSLLIFIYPNLDDIVESLEILSFTFTNECSNKSYELVIELHDLNLPFITPIDTEVCLGDSLLLEIVVNKPLTWTTDYPLNDPDSSRNFIKPDTSTIILVEVKYNLCIDTLISRIEVFPVSKFEVPDTFVCSGDSLNIKVIPEDIVGTFIWDPAENLNLADSSNPLFFQIVQNTTLNEYVLTIQDSNGCVARDSFTITTIALPQVSLMDDTVIVKGYALQLNGEITVDSFIWIPEDHLSDPSVLNPVASLTEDMLYILIAIDSNGCMNTDSILIEVVSLLLDIPTAFSPNSDGLNDELLIFNRGINELIRFEIYDRWGKLVYNTNDLNNPWKGIDSEGEKEVGIYTYILEAEDIFGNKLSKSGTIALVK